MSRRRQEEAAPETRGVKLEPVTNIVATRGYNIGKGVATTTVTIKADVPPTLADVVMDLAAAGAPLFATLGTDQANLFSEGAPPASEASGPASEPADPAPAPED